MDAARRAAVLDALSPLGDNVHGGEGAIYLWAKLPAGVPAGPRSDTMSFVPEMRLGRPHAPQVETRRAVRVSLSSGVPFE